MREHLIAGDRVYYTGDMANDPAWLTVTEVHTDSLNQPVYVTMQPDGGGKPWNINTEQIGYMYKGHCDPRFVTKKAYDAYRNQVMAAYR